MLFDGQSLADGSVQLGPIRLPRDSAQAMAAGKVKVAVRPEAWQVVPAGAGELAATVAKSAYLGSLREYTFDTELGAIFVVSADVARVWKAGEAVSLRLAGHGLSVVAA
jgi:iron(III) transport system ATP-binding protein